MIIAFFKKFRHGLLKSMLELVIPVPKSEKIECSTFSQVQAISSNTDNIGNIVSRKVVTTVCDTLHRS